MDHALRRAKQGLPAEAALDVLDRATSGVLALVDGDGAPYAVPLSHVRCGDVVFFHCAREGHKLEALASGSGKASFCVICQDEVVPEEFSTLYRSVIAFGTVRVVTDDGERMAALRALADKFSPGVEEGFRREVASAFDRVVILALEVERMTGKESRGLAEARRKAARQG